MRLELNISNKTIFFFSSIIVLMLILLGVSAWGGTSPSTMGHSWLELDFPDTNSNDIIDSADNAIMLNGKDFTQLQTEISAYTKNLPGTCRKIFDSGRDTFSGSNPEYLRIPIPAECNIKECLLVQMKDTTDYEHMTTYVQAEIPYQTGIGQPWRQRDARTGVNEVYFGKNGDDTKEKIMSLAGQVSNLWDDHGNDIPGSNSPNDWYIIGKPPYGNMIYVCN